MSSLSLTTPTAITDGIRAFCRRLTEDDEPAFFVDVDAPPDAVRAQCFPNVACAVRRGGGHVLCGWQIFEWPNVLREAHFHAIWVRPDGSALDVTPAPDKEVRMLFQRDKSRTYKGQLVASVREALWSDPSVLQYIRACQAHEAFRARYWVDDGGDNYGLLVDERERREHDRLELAVAVARQELEKRIARLRGGTSTHA